MTNSTAWLVLAIVAAIAEILSPLFGFFFVTVAALVGAIAASVDFSVPVQVILFVVVLVASLLVLRPRVLARLGARGIPSRTEALLGKIGMVTETVDPVLGSGRITVAGEDWAARCATPIPVGTRVRVDGADGIILTVSPL